jgi:hypothetical protein
MLGMSRNDWEEFKGMVIEDCVQFFLVCAALVVIVIEFFCGDEG